MESLCTEGARGPTKQRFMLRRIVAFRTDSQADMRLHVIVNVTTTSVQRLQLSDGDHDPERCQCSAVKRDKCLRVCW